LVQPRFLITLMVQIISPVKIGKQIRCSLEDPGGQAETLRRSKGSVFIALLLSTLFFLADGPPALAAVEPPYNEKLGELIQKLKVRGLPEEPLSEIFSDSRVTLYPAIVGRTGKGLDYLGRRFGLLTRTSIQHGKSVMAANREPLRKIEAAYGVGREVLVAILRIETNFGRSTGNYPLVNSLLTLALIENRRSSWAEEELVQLLLMCRRQNRDPLSLKGSWAGAFGFPQFIPSSYLKYGVDGNEDGAVDLYNLTDAFASIANYLRSFGWSEHDPEKNRQAVWAYNHCDNYVKAVFAYARAIKTVRKRPGKDGRFRQPVG
jgi:membrane-bound lytic murein transglycosylase B